jgi:hypothetical protein
MKPNNTSHTPGPWHIGKRACQLYVYGPLGEEVAGASSFTSGHEETLANARLIASAPDLLEALNLALATIERLAPSHRGFDSTCGTKDVICAAISKAEGSTHYFKTEGSK